ncbi:MAG: hypothetical protein ACK4ZJ_16180, partial [Allorhizobium sp.]
MEVLTAATQVSRAASSADAQRDLALRLMSLLVTMASLGVLQRRPLLVRALQRTLRAELRNMVVAGLLQQVAAYEVSEEPVPAPAAPHSLLDMRLCMAALPRTDAHAVQDAWVPYALGLFSAVHALLGQSVRLMLTGVL